MTQEIFIALGAAALVILGAVTFIMASVTRSELIDLRHSNELAHKDYVYQSRERFEKVERDVRDTNRMASNSDMDIHCLKAQVSFLDQEVKKLDSRIDGDCY